MSPKQNPWESGRDSLAEISDLMAFLEASADKSYTPADLVAIANTTEPEDMLAEIVRCFEGIPSAIPAKNVLRVMALATGADTNIVRQFDGRRYPFGRMRICLRRRLLEMTSEAGA